MLYSEIFILDPAWEPDRLRISSFELLCAEISLVCLWLVFYWDVLQVMGHAQVCKTCIVVGRAHLTDFCEIWCTRCGCNVWYSWW